MTKKIVAIHQPYFMPWMGFFDKLAQANIYIVLGSTSCDWRNQSVLNRNKIKTPTGPSWLTVPIHTNSQTKINEVKIDNSRNWQKDHLKTILFNYKKAKNFDKIYPKTAKIYAKKYEKIIDLNIEIINLFNNLLKIETKTIFDTELRIRGQKNELLINLVKEAGGDVYLSGLGAKNYLDLDLFRKAGIEVIWQDFKHPIYKQLWGEFTPNLSAIDYLLCDGRPLG